MEKQVSLIQKVVLCILYIKKDITMSVYDFWYYLYFYIRTKRYAKFLMKLEYSPSFCYGKSSILVDLDRKKLVDVSDSLSSIKIREAGIKYVEEIKDTKIYKDINKSLFSKLNNKHLRNLYVLDRYNLLYPGNLFIDKIFLWFYVLGENISVDKILSYLKILRLLVNKTTKENNPFV